MTIPYLACTHLASLLILGLLAEACVASMPRRVCQFSYRHYAIGFAPYRGLACWLHRLPRAVLPGSCPGLPCPVACLVTWRCLSYLVGDTYVQLQALFQFACTPCGSFPFILPSLLYHTCLLDVTTVLPPPLWGGCGPAPAMTLNCPGACPPPHPWLHLIAYVTFTFTPSLPSAFAPPFHGQEHYGIPSQTLAVHLLHVTSFTVTIPQVLRDFLIPTCREVVPGPGLVPNSPFPVHQRLTHPSHLSPLQHSNTSYTLNLFPLPLNVLYTFIARDTLAIVLCSSCFTVLALLGTDGTAALGCCLVWCDLDNHGCYHVLLGCLCLHVGAVPLLPVESGLSSTFLHVPPKTEEMVTPLVHSASSSTYTVHVGFAQGRRSPPSRCTSHSHMHTPSVHHPHSPRLYHFSTHSRLMITLPLFTCASGFTPLMQYINTHLTTTCSTSSRWQPNDMPFLNTDLSILHLVPQVRLRHTLDKVHHFVFSEFTMTDTHYTT
eukprot:6477704-Amphidinium_carterae.3